MGTVLHDGLTEDTFFIQLETGQVVEDNWISVVPELIIGEGSYMLVAIDQRVLNELLNKEDNNADSDLT